MFTILIQEKGGEQRRMVFNKPEVTIGRVQGNDIVLPKGNVSKRHARIVLKDIGPVPHVVRIIERNAGGHAGVGAEQVDLTVAREGSIDQAIDRGGVGDVDTFGHTVDLVGDRLSGGEVPVDDDHGAGAFGGEPAGQGRADPARASGDDDTGVLDVHQ